MARQFTYLYYCLRDLFFDVENNAFFGRMFGATEGMSSGVMKFPDAPVTDFAIGAV